MPSISLLQPAETQYSSPGMAAQALRSEGEKRALYLSEMDSFYAGLEQRQREQEQQDEQFRMSLEETIRSREQQGEQFGQQLGWEQERFGQELGWEREKFGESLDWEQSRFAQELGWEREKFGKEFSLKESELQLNKVKTFWDVAFGQRQSDIQDKMFEFESGEKFGWEKEQGGRMYDLQESDLDLRREQLSAQQKLQESELELTRMSMERSQFESDRAFEFNEKAFQAEIGSKGYGFKGDELYQKNWLGTMSPATPGMGEDNDTDLFGYQVGGGNYGRSSSNSTGIRTGSTGSFSGIPGNTRTFGGGYGY